MTENTVSIDKHPAADASKDTAPPSRRKRPLLVGAVWILLILLLLASGAGYWGYAQWQQQQQALTSLQSRVAELDQHLNAQLGLRASRSDLSRLAEETQSAQQAVQLAVAGMQTSLDEHKQRLDQLNQMLGQDASQWRLSEIERLLSAAQLRVGALDDPLGARQMLQEVERLASALGGESLPLRTAVQQLASALDRSVPLDRDGLALKIFNLAQTMPHLPLKSGEQAQSSGDVATPQDGWWAQTKAWFGSWMQIKNTDQTAASKPAPDQPQPLAAASQTLLEARAALLNRQVDEAYRLSAQALALAQQAKQIDGSAPTVQHALAQLRDISAALEQGYRPQTLDFAPAFVALRALRPPAASVTEPITPSLAPDDAPDDATETLNQTKEP